MNRKIKVPLRSPMRTTKLRAKHSLQKSRNEARLMNRQGPIDDKANLDE